MAFLWITAVKDLRRRLRDPLGLLVWLGVPFVVLALITLAFGGGGDPVKPQAHLLVADEDGSLGSQFLIAAFSQGPLDELVRVETVATADGREKIDRGEGSALLLIPAGFGERVVNLQPVQLDLVTNPAQRILPGILEETLSLVVDAVFYAQQLLEEPLRQVAAGPPPGADTFADPVIVEISIAVNQLVARAGDYLFPPRLDLETAVEEQPSSSLNMGLLFFQGMFFMSIFFMAQGMSDDVWQEREQGTLRRVVTTPRAVTAFLAGKLLAGGVLIGAVGLAGLTAGSLIYGFGLERVPLAALWTMFSGVLLLTLFTLLQLTMPTQQAGNVVSNVFTFPLVLAGGSFFPFELMPTWLAAIGRLTPNGWALEHLKTILSGTAEAGALGAALAGLTAMGGVAFALSAWRFRVSFAQG